MGEGEFWNHAPSLYDEYSVMLTAGNDGQHCKNKTAVK